jgi:serine/threonine protein kinase
MAPEQARGKSVDRRADIWSFGCVLYELLTGRRTFAGEEITDVLARLLERDPDWSLLPTATPIELRRLLARCLTKDPKARLRDIGEARVVIDELLSGKPAAPMPIAARSTTGSRPTVAVALPWTLAVLFAAAAAYALMPSPAAPVVTTPIHAQLSLPRRPHGSTIVPRVASGSVEPMVKAQRC